MTALIELEDVRRSFGTVRALRGATATITGRIVGLLGPNGAGKSTLIKCLLGLIAFEGKATVLGMSPAREGAAVRDRVGYMPENDAYLPGMSAVELCVYAAELSGLPRTEAMQRAHAALYYAGLEEKRYQPIDGYSTGQKQRVKLAAALVHDPELLFLDEPTNGLDPRSREEMLQLIVEMPERRGCSIVLSTHLLPDVDRVCDDVVIMHEGLVRFSGGIEALRRSVGGVYRIEIKDGAERLVAALATAGVQATIVSPIALAAPLPDQGGARLVFTAARDAGVQVRGLELEKESMEAAFLRVIGDRNPTGAVVA
ncbi:MAG: ABC transporter ATP-binding protein [Deltaproteobacteria bacterium]|nr:ABC transporter ATP-binding protein [Deltaproteobacteria bacterium]